MGRYPVGPVLCIEDSFCHVLIPSLREAVPLFVFSFWGFFLVTCGIFHMLRLQWMRQHPVSPVAILEHDLKVNPETGENIIEISGSDDLPHSTNSVNEKVMIGIKTQSEIRITGYTSTLFGEFCFRLSCFVSIHWILLFILILFDTYNDCEVVGIDNLCFFGNHIIFGTYNFNALVFFVVWWLSAIWFTGWVINKDKVHNWFRLPCNVSQAKFVYVWAPSQKEILSSNPSALLCMVRSFKKKINILDEGYHQLLKIQRTKKNQPFFLFQGYRYLIKGKMIQKASFSVGNCLSDFHKCSEGLTIDGAQERLELLGLNEVPYRPETFFQTVYAELFTLFHVYQLMMYLLWFWNSYLFVAALLSFIVVLSASITIYTQRQNQMAIAKITEYVTDAEVLRSGVWVKLDSWQLVPGDIVKIRSDWLLPCDFLVLQGSCVCDESALTGEAAPVQKYAAPDNSIYYQPEGEGSCARYTLFSGTTVLQAGTPHKTDALAVVTKTGMATSKGNVMSAILYPGRMLFRYDEELPIVAILLLLYAVVCFSISVIFQNLAGSQTLWVTKWMYCMATVNQIMNPLLPVALEIGQLQAVKRLQNCGIYCLNPKRIAIAGKIRVFCFDKTGTLTKGGLDFIGVQGLTKKPEADLIFGPVSSLHKGDSVDTLTMHGLATCHTVTKFGDQYIGNQVEVKMFQAVGWELTEGVNGPDIVHDGVSGQLKIIKRFEFDHTRATMSVIVQDFAGGLHLFCKGSFEKIQELSIQGSLPMDYLSTTRSHALNGCYVLALGYRNIGSEATLDRILQTERDELEKSLRFVSLILFRNELKDGSRSAILALKDGEVRPVMVTGDNAQCGHYIAKECGMIASNVQVLLGDVTNDSVLWSPMNVDIDNASVGLSTDELFKHHAKGLKCGTVELAITGKAFAVLRKAGMMNELLFYTRVFARFAPADKVLAVKLYCDCGLIVGMCGDGGNDCGALRAVHAGVALSDAEASVVSPFTSRDKSVSSVVNLLREGRGALHTSFACYKFLIMYGLMFSIFKLCCYWYGVIACHMDYIFIDGVAVLTLGYAMTLCYPKEKLEKRRPTSSLLGWRTAASVLGVWIANILFLIGALVIMMDQPGYVRWPAKYSQGASWWTLGDNWESTVLFFTMYFQFITSAFIYSFGSSFRKNILKNWLLLIFYGSLFVLMSLILLLPPSSFTSLWHVASEQFNGLNTSSPVWKAYQENGGSISPGMPFLLRLKIWFVILAGLITIIIWEKAAADGPIARAVAKKLPSPRLQFRN